MTMERGERQAHDDGKGAKDKPTATETAKEPASMKRAKEAASTDGEGIINKRVAQGPQSHACWPGEYQRHESLPVRALWAASWLSHSTTAGPGVAFAGCEPFDRTPASATSQSLEHNRVLRVTRRPRFLCSTASMAASSSRNSGRPSPVTPVSLASGLRHAGAAGALCHLSTRPTRNLQEAG